MTSREKEKGDVWKWPLLRPPLLTDWLEQASTQWLTRLTVFSSSWMNEMRANEAMSSLLSSFSNVDEHFCHLHSTQVISHLPFDAAESSSSSACLCWPSPPFNNAADAVHKYSMCVGVQCGQFSWSLSLLYKRTLTDWLSYKLCASFSFPQCLSC